MRSAVQINMNDLDEPAAFSQSVWVSRAAESTDFGMLFERIIYLFWLFEFDLLRQVFFVLQMQNSGIQQRLELQCPR